MSRNLEMVRRENLQTVRQAYADLNRGDIEAAIDAFADDASEAANGAGPR